MLHPKVVEFAVRSLTTVVTAVTAAWVMRAVRERERRAEERGVAKTRETLELGFRLGLGSREREPDRTNEAPIAHVIPMPRNGRREVRAKVNRAGER